MSSATKKPELVKSMILKNFDFLLAHNGAGSMKIAVKLLKRGQKEILIECGRVYRFVVDTDNNAVSCGENETN